MDVLITNAELGALGGTETYLYSLASEFKKRKSEYNLNFYSPKLGLLAEKISLLGYGCYNQIDKLKKRYDVIHLQHWKNLLPIRKRFPKAPVFYLTHGLGEQEIPPYRLSEEINLLAAISREVKEEILKGAPCSRMISIIPNAVDTERFKPKKPLREQRLGLRLLILSNYPSMQTMHIIELLKPILAKVTLVGRNAEPLLKAIKAKGLNPLYRGYDLWLLEEIINDNDLVISLGRGILEAMSCGRPAIVFGTHGGDGLVTKENVKKIMKSNFSGRNHGWDAKSAALAMSLQPLFKKDIQVLGKMSREIILAGFTLVKMVDRIENIYKSLARPKR